MVSIKLALPRGLAPRTLSFARRDAALLHLGSLASVAGLAPARLGLKARLLDRLCIHGRTMAAGVGLAPTPPVLQTGVQTLYTIQRRKMVVPAGNAPASPAYRAGALLLSYGTLAEGIGNAPLWGLPHNGAYADVALMRTWVSHASPFEGALTSDLRIKHQRFSRNARRRSLGLKRENLTLGECSWVRHCSFIRMSNST